jgi:manganese-dependent ADP-ribose/CDP-alcohol diphosphatase
MWDYDEMLALVESPQTGGCVKCVISGHQHEGAMFTCDKYGVHYLGMESPMLASDESPGPFAVVDVFDDKIVFKGYGRDRSSILFPFAGDAAPSDPIVREFAL